MREEVRRPVKRNDIMRFETELHCALEYQCVQVRTGSVCVPIQVRVYRRQSGNGSAESAVKSWELLCKLHRDSGREGEKYVQLSGADVGILILDSGVPAEWNVSLNTSALMRGGAGATAAMSHLQRHTFLTLWTSPLLLPTPPPLCLCSDVAAPADRPADNTSGPKHAVIPIDLIFTQFQ
ncbi:hypothetical protein Baya_10994 [Bagarius yarrelli]|uniref:Uncharacterized protein n=1 Tax=Bagarius yarrelli TaxID=175774 RepID=A0A556UYK2_BAGYA|nr:hypothetical protein Baya_10994 [Bagarius yarrelli]